MKIAIIKLDITSKPTILAIQLKKLGNTDVNKMIMAKKYQSNEYLIGILPFFNIEVVIINKIIEKTNKD